MNAEQKIKAMLKEVYEDGDVNAMSIWKGYDAGTGNTGWHYRWFGRSDAHCMGNSLAEAREYIEEVKSTREAAF